MPIHSKDKIIRSFKLLIKKYKKDREYLVRQRYYERIVELLIKEVRGEQVDLSKYFEDSLPTDSPQYFEYIYHTFNPVRSLIHYRYGYKDNTND